MSPDERQQFIGTLHLDLCEKRNMKIKELCNDDRPREKMASRGSEALSNSELIAILLRTGTQKKNVLEMGQELMKQAGGNLITLASMSISELCRMEGIGPGKAITLAAAFELGRRMSEESIGTNPCMNSPRNVFRILGPHLRHLDHEECWAIYLNTANRMTGKERISSGGFNSTLMDNRFILHKALEQKAAGLIIAHNHPSGDMHPSVADINATQELSRGLKACGISLIDHVIISADGYYSFADEESVIHPSANR